MKRIVNGITYNTDTATMIARAEGTYEDQRDREVDWTAVLYQTRLGAFFLVETTVTELDEETTRDRTDFTPMTAEKAQSWILKDANAPVEIIHNPFQEDPPEAASEDEPGATIYIRVPVSLKKRVEQAAAEANLSTNAWAMRCVEQCLPETFRRI